MSDSWLRVCCLTPYALALFAWCLASFLDPPAGVRTILAFLWLFFFFCGEYVWHSLAAERRAAQDADQDHSVSD